MKWFRREKKKRFELTCPTHGREFMISLYPNQMWAGDTMFCWKCVQESQDLILVEKK